MHFVDGLGGETGGAVARVEQPFVQRLEVVWSESAQRDRAERGQHMTFDVAAVAVIGAVGEHDAFAWKPTGRQVDTKGHRAPQVVASVVLPTKASSFEMAL